MKQTTLKHIHTLAARVRLDLEDLFKGRWGLGDSKTWEHGGLDQAINSFTEDWGFWYDGVIRDASNYHGDTMLDYLKLQSLDITPLHTHVDDEDNPDFDEALRDCFELDVARAYVEASKQAAEADFSKRVYSAVEDAISDVGAPYYCLLKVDRYRDDKAKKIRNRGWVETDELYEAECVVFGFTHQWHQDVVASTTWYGGTKPTYDPDEIESWANSAVEEVKGKIDTDWQINEYASDEAVLDLFRECNEVEDLLRKRQEQLAEDARREAEHTAWVARCTARMIYPTPDLT